MLFLNNNVIIDYESSIINKSIIDQQSSLIDLQSSLIIDLQSSIDCIHVHSFNLLKLPVLDDNYMRFLKQAVQSTSFINSLCDSICTQSYKTDKISARRSLLFVTVNALHSKHPQRINYKKEKKFLLSFNSIGIYIQYDIVQLATYKD